jgi:hypothetical protein
MAQEQAQDETERQAAEHRAEPLQHRHGDGADQACATRWNFSYRYPHPLPAPSLGTCTSTSTSAGSSAVCS